MCQRIRNIPERPAEPSDPDSIPINEPSAIQVVYGAFVSCHRSGRFLRSGREVPVGIWNLHHEESLASQRLGCKGCRPRAVHPELSRIPAMGLKYERIFLACDKVWRPIKPASYRGRVEGAPGPAPTK